MDSKTALGAAFLLRRRGRVRVVGLTAAGHRAFVESTGCFDAVGNYDALDALPLELPVAYVDFSGNAALRFALHERLGAALVHSLHVGSTHAEALAHEKAPPGVAVASFFGPAQIRKRRGEWGAEALHARYASAESPFIEAAAGWLRIERRSGPAALARAWQQLLQGLAEPDRAFVCSLAGETTPTTAEECAALSFLQPQPLRTGA